MIRSRQVTLKRPKKVQLDDSNWDMAESHQMPIPRDQILPHYNKVISLVSSPAACRYKRRFKLGINDAGPIKVDHSDRMVEDGDDIEPGKPLS
jgi:hypothetical protein